MGGAEEKEGLSYLLSTASEIFQTLPSVLARGRELEVTLLDPDVKWYIENSYRVLVLWLCLAEQGVNPCPHVAREMFDESLRAGS